MTQEAHRRHLNLNANSMYRDIFKLALPVMMGTALHMVFNLVDVAWVSRLGAVQVAIPALAGSLLWLFMSLAEAISIGTVSMIARFEGAGKRQLLPHVVVHGFWLGLALAVIIGVVVTVYAEPLLLLFTDDVELLPSAVLYLRITALGLVATFCTYAISSGLNGIGDTMTPMIVMAATNAINLVLDPFLIFGWAGFPRLGVLGAAWATLAANFVSLLVMLVIAFRRQELGIKSLLVPLNLSIVGSILRIGFPACLQSAARSSTGTVMFWLVMSGYGTAAAAAFGAGQRVIGLTFVFMSGLAVASTTLIGQLLGLGDKALAKLAARRLILMGIGVQVTVGLLYILFAYPINYFFLGDNPEAMAAGVGYIRICGLGMAMGASSGVLGGIFRGAGYTMPTFLAGFVANWVVKLPIAALGTLVFAWPVDGIWWAIAASVLVEWSILMIWQLRGTWLHREIRVRVAQEAS